MKHKLAVYNLEQDRRSRILARCLELGEVALRVFALALAALFLTAALGCQKPEPVPVPCPEAPRIQRPVLRVKALPPDATERDTLTAYVLDLVAMVGYADQLDALLDGYRTTPAPALPSPSDAPKPPVPAPGAPK